MRQGKSVNLPKRYRVLKKVSAANAVVLVIVLIFGAFISGPSIFNTRAEEILVCMRICTVGDPCDPGVCANPPSVSTQAVSNISTGSARGNGTVVSNGGDSITERGFALSEDTDPTTDDTTYIASTNGTGSYFVTLSNLSQGTTYYVRAYAINSIDTSYGTVVSFTTSESGGQQNQNQQQQSQGPGTPQPVDTRPVEVFLRENATAPENNVLTIRNNDLTQSILVNRSAPLTLLSFDQPVFYGTTTIREAYIFVTTPNGISIGTTVANSEGQWSWRYPNRLPPGTYTLYFTAMSPENSAIRDTITVTFAISLREDVDEPLPETNLPITEDEEEAGEPDAPDFIVDLDITDDGDPDDGITARTRIINLGAPETREANLIFRLIDSTGNPVYEESRPITVTDESTIDVTIIPSQSLQPGLYTLQVTLDDEEQQLITSENLVIEDPVVVDYPFITLQTSQVETGIRNTAIGLTASLAVFLILLRREYITFRRRPYQLNDNDILDSNLVK